MTKKWYKSKQVWFNVLTAVVAAATILFGYQPNTVITENVTSVLTNPLFIAGVNFLLRLITTKTVTL